MHQKQFEIVVLRPTAVFLSFLASQLPEQDIPSLKLLHTDNTAYVIEKQTSEEATVDEIEKHFTTMFRHEISRWLGPDARNEIENNFLDFLCCFKFEIHSHIILMEPSLKEGRQVLAIKPRSVLLNWMKNTVEEQEELVNILEKVTLSQLAENATVLVKNFPTLNAIKPFLNDYYQPIFETAMSRMSQDVDQWPEIKSFQEFSKYFSIEIHTQLIYLHH
ncbi:MAG: hypothetical protein Q8M40_03320 [Legionella sp.]|nr:hypothetical protein [Legionella sp.]